MHTEDALIGVHEEPKAARRSTIRDIINLFYSPSETFTSLKAKPRWLVPYILIVLCVVAYTILTWHAGVEDRIKDLQADGTVSQEEYEYRMSAYESMRAANLKNMHMPSFIKGIVIIGIVHAIFLFGVALLFWLPLHLFTPKVSYKGVLAVCGFSFLVGIFETLIMGPLILARGTAKIYPGLAALLPQDWHGSPLFYLFKQMDVFTVWELALLIIGISIVVGISKKKAAVVIGGYWGIWLLLVLLMGDIVSFGAF